MSNDKAVSPETKDAPKCILVVEDNIALQFALSEWLRMRGYTVYEAATADEAVTILGSPNSYQPCCHRCRYARFNAISTAASRRVD